MNAKQSKLRIEKLKKVISYHRYLYHVLDKQEISDAALDSLKHELYKLEEVYPEFVTVDSPTQRISGEPLKEFKKVEHKIPMLSIEDVFTEEELKKWEDYLKRLSPSRPERARLAQSRWAATKFEYFSEMKIDGFAITLIYKNGFLNTGATRGNGRIGEDVIQNLKTIESIPLKLEIKGKLPSKEIEKNIREQIRNGKIEIRGEVYITKKAFEKFNQKLMKKGEKTYSNPRNLAAGSIRQLNPKSVAPRPLRFLAYDIITDLGQKKHSQEHQILPCLGFKTDSGRASKDLNQVVDFWRKIAKKRETLPFQIDGIVVSVDNNYLFQKLGVIGKSPRAVRAFKFSPEQATTIVKDIKVQLGRTGAVTPVAYLKPVKVGGVMISRATLHNANEIKKLGVRIGDTVIVERAGDVIPAVVKVLADLRTGKERNFLFPKLCPTCGTKLIKPAKEVIWRCPNKNCSARKRKFIYHFTSKKAFDVKGLGPKIINQLIDENLVSQFPDIFELKQGDLIPLGRFAEKSAENLIDGIQKSKKITLGRFIYSLGIRHVGEETAINLANYFGSVQKLKEVSKEELEKISDIGQVVAETVYDWFQSKRNQKLLLDIQRVGVKLLSPEKIGKKLSGKTFVLTGVLKTLTRNEAEKKIRMLGGHTTDSISKQTDFLVAGKKPGSKYSKAKKLGIKVIDEKEFLKMI